MNCANPPEVPSKLRCHFCRQSVGSDCSKDYRGKLICPRCSEFFKSRDGSSDGSSLYGLADLSLKLALAGVVLLGLSRFTSLFFPASLGYSLGALMMAREAKRRLLPSHGPKERIQVDAALLISACIIMWMILMLIIGVLLVLFLVFFPLND